MGLFIFISSPLSNNVLKSHCFNSSLHMVYEVK